MGWLTRSDARFPIDCFAGLLIRRRIPRTAPDRLRAHQNRTSWFGEEVLNAHVEIGDDGVKIGQVDHKACEDLRRRSDRKSVVVFRDGDLHLGSGTEVEPVGLTNRLN
jgi:hypothetical protein